MRTLDGLLRNAPGIERVPRAVFTLNFSSPDVLYPSHTAEHVRALQDHHETFGEIVINDRIAIPELAKYRLGVAPYLTTLLEDFVFVLIVIRVISYD